MEAFHILVCSIAVFLGGILHGCFGFGCSFIILPVFSIFFPPALSTATIVLLNLTINLTAVFSCMKDIQKKYTGLLLIGGVIGIPVGTVFLQQFDSSVYSIMAGASIAVAAGLLLAGNKLPMKNKAIYFLPTGILSGILNAWLSLSGPPVILFLNNQKLKKNAMRATLISYFLLINLFTLLWFAYNKVISDEIYEYLKFFIPMVIAGTLTGTGLSRYVTENIYKKITLICVILISVVLAIKNFNFILR